ncbi:MAG: hypothetical protein M3N10_08885 [Actinomycetota bacterium]|nr:hypothetical protein [Actinomycetota bacterium]HZY64598.1 hypothetical protein [Rubrobacteraceae bacterium]
MSDTYGQGGSNRPGDQQSGIIVFGGGGGGRGCSGRGCLFWIVLSVVLSVGLTILVNLILLLFSGGGSGINV